MALRFLYPVVLWCGIPIVISAAWWRLYRRVPIRYRFAHTHLFAVTSGKNNQSVQLSSVLFALRMIALILLVVAAGRPQTPVERTEIQVEGVSIMIALDVSQSMYCFDDPKAPKSRFVIAQEEAVSFVKRRMRDQIGLILFGEIAATKCPLTSDRVLVVECIRSAELGMIPDEGTALSQAIIMGVRRLQSSSALSKVLVILTDGVPSQNDAPFIHDAVAVAQKSKVKIYTIGIGSPSGGYIQHPSGGMMRVPLATWNKELLMEIAGRTGGSFFAASNQRELEDIYHKIDQLECSVQQEPQYAQWFEWYIPCVIGAFIICSLEIALMIGCMQLC